MSRLMVKRPPSRAAKARSAPVHISSGHVFEALRCICSGDQPIGVAEIARAIGEPVSSAHRALATLENAGYAARVGLSSKLVPGPMPYHLVRAMLARFPIRLAAMPYLKQIAVACEHTVTLTIRLGWYGVLANVVDGPREVYRVRRLGEVGLLSESPAGLAMLATLDEHQVARYQRFVHTHHRAKYRPLLAETCERVRRDGFAAAPDELEPGLRSVALPMTTVAAHTVWAVSIVGPYLPDGAGRRSSKLIELRTAIAPLREHYLANPELAVSPYVHIEPDEIVLPLFFPD